MIYDDYYRRNKGSKKHALSRWLFDKVFFFLKQKPKDVNLNKILIIDNGHIGDVVMSTAIFGEIKKNYPNILIDVLTTNLSKPILEKNPHINNIITSDLFWRKETRNWKTFWEYLALLNKLKDEKYDFGIAIRSDLPNILTLYLAGIKNRAAYYNLDGGKPLLTHALLYPEEEIHASLADIDLINYALCIEANNTFPEIYIEDKKINSLFLNKYICIVPGACAKLQTWNKMKYRAIIEWMAKEYPDYHIMLAGSKEDESLINMLSLYNSKCIKLINHDLRDLGLIFNMADGVLLQDGGPMHIAYTMMTEADKKLIVLWGPNPLDHVAPLRGKIIHYKLDCYPCMRQESQCKKPEGQKCIDLITVEEVKQEIKKAISQDKQ